MKNNIRQILVGLFTIVFNHIGTTQNHLLSKSESSPKFIITNVSIFNGKDSLILPYQDVFVNNGIIEKIIATGTSSFKGYDTINGSNKFIMPGLIDAHLHIQSNGSTPWAKTKHNQNKVNESLLYCGITTAFDLGGIAFKSKKIKKKSQKGKMLCPDLFNSHIPMTIPGAHPIPASKEALPFPLNKMADGLVPTVSSKKSAQKVVKKYVKQDIDFVKIICDELPPGTPEMDLETLKSIIVEVHKHKLKAVVHVGSSENAVNAIKAGADVLAHGIYRGLLSEDDARFIAKSKIPIIYTLYAFEFNFQMVQGLYTPTHFDSLLLEKVILKGISGKNGLQVESSGVIHSFTSSLVKQKENWKNNLSILRKYNAKIIVGTDAGTPGYGHGTAIYHEIDELIKYGMSNFEVLNAATHLSSFTFFDTPNFGLIAEGYEADMLILNDNPLKNINSIKQPDFIISNGQILKRE
jgi:imidazolonepropionase-like amidohydrolase